MDGNRVFSLIEQHAVIANTEAKQSIELAAQWFDATYASLGVSVQGDQNLQGSVLLGGFASRGFNRSCCCGPDPW